MSAELSYKDLEQKVEYQDMSIEQLHPVITGLKRDRFGKKSEGFENPFQAQLPFQIDETIKDIPEQETELSVADHKRTKKKTKKRLELPRRIIIV